MDDIMNSPKGVKSGIPERVIISCHTCGNRHDSFSLEYVTVGKQAPQHVTRNGQISVQSLYDDHRV